MLTRDELQALPGRTLLGKALFHLHATRPGFDQLTTQAQHRTARQLVRQLGLPPARAAVPLQIDPPDDAA